jgi:hypothetical protein
MKLTASPLAIKDRFVPWAIIAQYFDAHSLHALVLALWRHRRSGYFAYDVTLSAEYIDWEDTRRSVVLRTDVLEPIDPFGALKIGKYRLNHLYSKILNKTPFTDDEINEVIEKLPADMAERYLLFRITNIDQDSITA